MILRRLEKILTLKRHFRSTWLMRSSFRKMLLTWRIILTTPNITALALGVSKIFDLEITMNYIGKTLRRHYDATSGPIGTKLNTVFHHFQLCNLYSKFEGNRTIFAEITNMTLLVHFYIAQILPEPEVVRLSVYYIKNWPWFPLSKALTFHSNRTITLQRYKCISNFA